MLKGRNAALVLSLVIHAVMLLLLLNLNFTLPDNTHKPEQAIKSYIYTPPKPAPHEIKTEKQPELVKQPLPAPEFKAEPAPKEKTPVTKKSEEPTIVQSKEPASPSAPAEQAVEAAQKPVSKKFSSFNQLKQLRNSIDRQILQQEFSARQATRSPSVMHAQPAAVPHSVEQLTDDEKKARNTTNYSDGLKITKNDNGTCTIEEDLSNVGIQGVTAVQGFACGESKFDKSFREHMKKVQQKLAR